MICPRCQAEYRPGFTHCVDCDVDLVWELPKTAVELRQARGPGENPAPGGPGDPNEDPYCSFWKGDDPRVHAELCEVLEQAGIPHNTVYRRDHLFNLRTNAAYEVGVPFSMYERAEQVVKEAYQATDEEDVGAQEGQLRPQMAGQSLRRLPATLAPEGEEKIPGPPSAGNGSDGCPEGATKKVWSTERGESSDFLVSALQENGIHCRVDKNHACSALYVLPDDENRAREIVREVVEGAPPD